MRRHEFAGDPLDHDAEITATDDGDTEHNYRGTSERISTVDLCNVALQLQQDVLGRQTKLSVPPKAADFTEDAIELPERHIITGMQSRPLAVTETVLNYMIPCTATAYPLILLLALQACYIQAVKR